MRRRNDARHAATDEAPHTLTTGSNAPDSAPPRLEQRIGREIRRRRERLGLTGAQLAAASGISNGMLSKIETGQISSSLTTLDAIAAALNTPIATLFVVPEARRDCSFVKHGEGVAIDRRGTKAGHRYQLIGHSLSGDVAIEPYLITLSTEAQPYTAFQHAGMEMIYMLTGRVTYRHEDKLFDMTPGDTLFFDAAGQHGPAELTALPMTYLSIIIYPKS